MYFFFVLYCLVFHVSLVFIAVILMALYYYHGPSFLPLFFDMTQTFQSSLGSSYGQLISKDVNLADSNRVPADMVWTDCGFIITYKIILKIGNPGPAWGLREITRNPGPLYFSVPSPLARMSVLKVIGWLLEIQPAYSHFRKKGRARDKKSMPQNMPNQPILKTFKYHMMSSA